MVEVTTYRAEVYRSDSRKPEVSYGDSLDEDLRRRDFTVNAMAVTLPGKEFVDPYGGLADLAAGLLRTPGRPEDSFDDDPLRMLRAARFAAQLGFAVDPAVDRGDDRDGRADRDRLRRAGARRAGQAGLRAAAAGRAGAAGADRAGRRGCCPSCRGWRLEIDEHHRHKDVYEHTLTVLEQAIALEPQPGRRTSCCGWPR